MSFQTLRDEHRRWLGHHGLLDRPWFVLGSAPNPTIPEGLLDRAALICINNSGVTPDRLGMQPADLTLRNKSKEWKTITGMKVPLMLWVCNRPPWRVRWKRFFIAKNVDLGEIRVLPREDRKLIGESMLREPDSDAEVGKPSTGVFAVLYGLFAGIPEIVLGGMSMDKYGYSYQTQRMRMLHRDEDRIALETLARRFPAVKTTEPAVAEGTGLQLYSGPAAGAGHAEPARRSCA